MGMESQLRQSNFGSFSTASAQLRQGMDYDVASEVIGAYCVTGDDKEKEWFVKVPNLTAAKDSSLIDSPDVTSVTEREQEVPEHMLEPSEPVRCLPDLRDSVASHAIYQAGF